MISYISSRQSLSATRWNPIFAAANDYLKTALGGISAIFLPTDYLGVDFSTLYLDTTWERKFFFFDPLNPPSGLHPLVYQYLLNCQNFIPSATYGTVNLQPSFYFRQYSDAAIDAQVALLSVVVSSSDFKVVQLSLPVWTTWSAAVYPSGFGTQGTYGLTSGSNATYNCLDLSLKIIKKNIGGDDYSVTLKDVTTAQHAEKFTPIEIFVNANFTWDSNWDKYSVVRIHNCAAASVDATFGLVKKTLKPGACFCFRKSGSAWSAGYDYFHAMQSGDGRYSKLLGIGDWQKQKGSSASIFWPMMVTDLLEMLLLQSGITSGKFFDINEFWDVSSIYNNALYTRQSTLEINPPTGGYFPTLNTSCLLGDLIVPRGKFLVVNRNSTPSTAVQIDFAGFAGLEATLNAAGINSRSITLDASTYGGPASFTTREFYTSTNWHLVDLSTGLVTFLNGGEFPSPAKAVGASQASSPKSVIWPFIFFTCINAASTSTPINQDWYEYTDNGDGTYSANDTVAGTASVDNAGNSKTQTQTVFRPTDLVSDFIAWMESISTGISLSNFALKSTVFGTIITWEETWPIAANFTGIGNYGSYTANDVPVNTISISQSSGNIIVKRGLFLNMRRGVNTGDGSAVYEFGIFPPPMQLRPANIQYSLPVSLRTERWHFPRVNRQFVESRWFYHDPADAPLMPNWKSLGGSPYSGSDYVNIRYANWTSYYPNTPGDLNIGNNGNYFFAVKSFYEDKPIGDDEILGPACREKTGLSFPGQFRVTADIWCPFAYWLNSLGNLSYATAPDLGGTGSISISSSWYDSNYSHVLANDTITNPIQNESNTQIEHINLLASKVNAQAAALYKVGSGSKTKFKLNFAAANIIIVNGGTGHSVGDALSFNLKVGSVDGSGKVLTVVQNGTVVENEYDAFSTPVRPFSLGGDITGDTSVGDGSDLNFIPTYFNPGIITPPTVDSLKVEHAWLKDTYWPKESFFSWNGPSVSGAADPVGDYFSTNFSATIQDILPYSYGDPVSDGVGGYKYGCNANWESQAKSYRWITIDTARDIYDNLNVPFWLDKIVVPYEWTISGEYPDFVNDDTGLLVRKYNSENICDAGSTLANRYHSYDQAGVWYPPGYPYYGGTAVPVYYPSRAYDLIALIVIRENLKDLLLVKIPQNFIYADYGWIASNVTVYASAGGTVVPLVAEGSLESGSSEIVTIPGTDTSPFHDISTALINARVLTQILG